MTAYEIEGCFGEIANLIRKTGETSLVETMGEQHQNEVTAMDNRKDAKDQFERLATGMSSALYAPIERLDKSTGKYVKATDSLPGMSAP